MKKGLYFGRIMNIFYMVSIILPLLIISLFAMNYSKSFLMDLSKSNSLEIAGNLKISVETFFEAPKRSLNILKDVITSKDTNLEADDIFELLSLTENYFDHYVIVESDGIVTSVFPKNIDLVGFDYSKNREFIAIKEGAVDNWSKTDIDSDHEEASIDYAVPLGDKVLIGTIHLENLKKLFEKMISSSDVKIGITDDTGVYILHSNYKNVEQRVTDPFVNNRDLSYDLVEIDGIEYYGTSISSDYQGWKIVVYENADILNSKIARFVFYLSVIIIVLAVIVLIIGSFLNRFIVKSLNTVVDKTKEVAAGEYKLENKGNIFREFNEIDSNFMHMAKKIEKREFEILNQSHEIEELNKDLELKVIERTNELTETLENLKSTQEQLIESEKLASLGNLIAGLAHEINTPLGVLVTVVTYLQEISRKTHANLNNGSLKKSELDLYLTNVQEGERIIYDNVTRANELIGSFKLISAEQRTLEARTINICDYIKSIIKSMTHQMKKIDININLDCEDDIEIMTIPLSIYQIMVNLIINIKIHAYKNEEGIIDIKVNKVDDGVQIIVEDYGKGIPEENIKKIFEPFFTTNRGEGGTGLGLNITYNIIKQNLNGNIWCESELDKGTKFFIWLPNTI